MEEDARLERLMMAWRRLTEDGKEFVINAAEIMQKYPGTGRLSVIESARNEGCKQKY